MSAQIEGTHQHAKSGKAYAYSARYSIAGTDIVWQARIELEGRLRAEPGGTIQTGSPAAQAIAEKAVLDAVLASIDALDDVAGV
ncbi:MAG: hypothetical protein AB1430_18795 [Pseudomonadota bacterium]